MICCINCFKDKDIKSRIESLSTVGDCEICGSKNVFIYKADSDNILTDAFDGLLDIYKPASLLPDDYPRGKLNFLKDELYTNWNIFCIDKDKIDCILKNICNEKYSFTPEIFDSPVGIPELVQEIYLTENSLLRTFDWDDFVKAIKTENRFHTKYINTEVLRMLCTYIKKSYKKGAVFYRARMSDKDGYPTTEMKAPPADKATAGRANSDGISCLYLASDIKTTLYEIRAGRYDFVTVGKFVLKHDIDIVDLTNIDNISAFTGLDFTRHAINKEHLRKINNEIAKPLRRNDPPLDYLPTQYISDFIKSIEHDGKKEYSGIEYKSTMCNSGYNLAIFDENLFECGSVSVHHINDLEYDYS